MPFPIVYGVPRSDLKVLRVLRQEIIDAVAEAMGIKPSIVRPFFPMDLVGGSRPRSGHHHFH